MLVSHFIDLVPIWTLLVATVLIQVLFIELGFRLGKRAQAHKKKEQTSQVRAIMGAGLGLLAFMLAFTFNTAQTHFETRVQNLAEEARICRNAFMQAELLPEPAGSQAKKLLGEYVGLRAGVRSVSGDNVADQLSELIQISEDIQHQLWTLATEFDAELLQNSDLEHQNGPFLGSVLALSDIHFTRVHSGIMNRIPFTIWLTIYLMAILSMIIVGYQAGLIDRRSPVATMTLAFAFSAVIILITDLDRPVMSFFNINNQLLVNLHEDMQAELQPEYYRGE